MSFNVPTSIAQAVNFLARPLALIHAPAMTTMINNVLRSALHVAFLQISARKLVLTFTVATPPRPVFATCQAIGIRWAEWIELLGNQEFSLIIESDSVAAHYSASENKPSRTVVIWTAPTFTANKRALLARLTGPQVPISKLQVGPQSVMKTQRSPISPITTPRIFVPSSTPYVSRTLAQQLLDSDHEEADQLLSMISNSAIISPTPTREKFALNIHAQVPIRHSFASFSPISSPEPSSPESSRPSSRSSTFSTFSVSDDESLSSATSSSSSIKSEFVPRAKAPSFRPAAARKTQEPCVYVDASKKNITKYLYQGGMSNTLTGGVMLGKPSASASAARPSPAKPAPTPAAVPKYRAPIGGRKNGGASAPTWRRNQTLRA